MRARFVVTKLLGALATLLFVLVVNFFLFRVISDDPVGKLFRALVVFGIGYGGLNVAMNSLAVDIVAALRRPVMPSSALLVAYSPSEFFCPGREKPVARRLSDYTGRSEKLAV